MSTPGHGSEHPALEGDGIDIKKILAVGGGSLAIFALSCVVAYLILRHDSAEADAKGRPPVPALIGQDEIGIVDQPEFANDHRLEEWKAAKQHRLNSYGWVDKSKSLIHIPIDKAIDQVVSEAGNQP
jgi:hypothetical protein